MILRTIPYPPSFRLSLLTLLIALGICAGLVACGSGGGNNAGQVGSQPPAPPTAPQFAYVASTVDNKIHMYSVNPSTGQLTDNGKVDAGTSPTQIAFDPNHRFAYVANQGSFDVSMYTLDKHTGLLTPNGTIGTGGLNPSSVTVDPSGRFVYVTNQNSGGGVGVSAFSINQTTGALTAIGAVPAGVEPWSVAVEPTGHFAYISSGDGTPANNFVHTFSIDQITGALTAIGTPAPGPAIAVHVRIHPSGHFVYLASGVSHALTGYKIDTITGALTKIDPPGSLSTGGTASRAVAVNHTGQFAYVANIGTNDVSTFQINQTTGALTLAGLPTPLPIPAGGNRSGNEGARWIVAHPSEPFLYVTYLTDPPPYLVPNHIPAHVAVFQIKSDGSLTHIGDTPTGDGSVGITVITP